MVCNNLSYDIFVENWRNFHTLGKTRHMSIILLRSRVFLRACCGACHRACRWNYRKTCYNFRQNFPQVLPYGLPQGVFFSMSFSSPFIFFLFLRSLLAPNFLSLSHLVVQLPRSKATPS